MIFDSIFVVRGVNASEIHVRMAVQNGDNCMSQSKVYKWVGRFKEGPTSVDTRSGRPQTVTHVDVNKQTVNTYRNNGKIRTWNFVWN